MYFLNSSLDRLPSPRCSFPTEGSGAISCLFSAMAAAPGGQEWWGTSRPEPFHREDEANRAASFWVGGEATQARHTNRNNFEKEGHMRQARYRFFLLPLFFVLACVGAFAQANSELTGIVTDQTGAVVAGAKIVLTDPATGRAKTRPPADQPACTTLPG